MIDTVAIVSYGVYSETFGQAELKNRCNLYASLGFLEDAPNVLVKIINIAMYLMRMRRE